MANLVSYINRHGDETFNDKPFNIIDKAILAQVSYVDFKKHYTKPTTLGDIAERYFKSTNKHEIKKHITGVRSSIKILDYIRDEERYRNLVVHDYICINNKEEQFAAICIDIDETTTFISFEGTDELIIGWKEDFDLCYKFPLPSHKSAIKYVNRVIKLFSNRKYIIGGHSKGGNLALVSSMCMNSLKKRHVKEVLSFDGPGLRDKEFFSRKYKKILPKYKLIVPDQSIVGLLLYENTNPIVVKANKKGFIAHDMTNWELENDDFIPSKLSKMSNKMNVRLYDWLEMYSYKEREVFVNELFAVLKRANIDSLIDIKESKVSSIINIIRATKGLDLETKRMIKEMIMFIVNLY